MQVSRLDDGLAVRLPDSVVEALGLKEGDNVEVRASGPYQIDLEKPMTREEALELLRKLRRPLPSDYKFDRIEANER